MKKIPIDTLIETLNAISEADIGDTMEGNDCYKECINKAVKFLVQYSLLNEDRIDVTEPKNG